ncbi:MAG: hypothetical protein RLZZ241_172 [Bacteroidota bacterium]|jgi:hypothetical protein
MPFVKEQDLIQLHQDIENAQRDNLALLQQLSAKDREVRIYKHQRMVMVGLSLSLLIVTLSIMAFAAGMVTQSREVTREVMQVSQEVLESSQRKSNTSLKVNKVIDETAEKVTIAK